MLPFAFDTKKAMKWQGVMLVSAAAMLAGAAILLFSGGPPAPAGPDPLHASVAVRYRFAGIEIVQPGVVVLDDRVATFKTLPPGWTGDEEIWILSEQGAELKAETLKQDDSPFVLLGTGPGTLKGPSSVVELAAEDKVIIVGRGVLRRLSSEAPADLMLPPLETSEGTVVATRVPIASRYELPRFAIAIYIPPDEAILMGGLVLDARRGPAAMLVPYGREGQRANTYIAAPLAELRTWAEATR